MKTLAFFNNKGGVGKTALVYHLAWMFAERGVPVLAADLDPQSNLTSMFLAEDRLAECWQQGKSIVAALTPLISRSGDAARVHTESITTGLHTILGDLGLSRFEDLLSENWAKCLTGEEGAFRVISALHRVMREAAHRVGAQLILIDLGPNLGALNRAVLLAADHLVLPLAPDLFSVQGMENLGPTLRDWRKGWEKRVGELQNSALDLPEGRMQPVGYVVMSFGVRDVRAYDDWLDLIPVTYRRAVLGEDGIGAPSVEQDPYRLAALKHYRSLMPLAMTAHKPMFSLRPAEGARGAHLEAVHRCHDDFLALAVRIGALIGIAVS